MGMGGIRTSELGAYVETCGNQADRRQHTTGKGDGVQNTHRFTGLLEEQPTTKHGSGHWSSPPPPGNSPSPGRPTPGVVKQDKSSGGSVDTTKTRSGPQRVRMSSGERPIGAAKGKQPNTAALCQPPPPARDRLSRATLPPHKQL